MAAHSNLIDLTEEDEDQQAAPKLIIPIPLASVATAPPAPPLEDDDDRALCCPICFFPLDHDKGHESACLACGHVFGDECLRDWLKDNHNCPSCATPANLQDVRRIFLPVNGLPVLKVKLVQRLEQESKRREQVDAENTLLRDQVHQLTMSCARRWEEEVIVEAGSSQGHELEGHSSRGIKRGRDALEATNTTTVPTPDLSLMGRWSLANGRVCGFASWPSSGLSLLLASTRLSASGDDSSYGLVQINLSQGVVQSGGPMPLAQGPIRDIKPSPHQPSQVLITGLDKSLSLVSLSSPQPVVSRLALDSPGWCTTWHTTNPYQIYIGLQNGNIQTWDLRNIREPLHVLVKALNGETQPIHSLSHVPLADCGIVMAGNLAGAWGWGQASINNPPVKLSISDNMGSCSSLTTMFSSSNSSKWSPPPVGLVSFRSKDDGSVSTGGIHHLFQVKPPCESLPLPTTKLTGHTSKKVLSRSCLWESCRELGKGVVYVSSGDEATNEPVIWRLTYPPNAAAGGITPSSEVWARLPPHESSILDVVAAHIQGNDLLASVSGGHVVLHKVWRT